MIVLDVHKSLVEGFVNALTAGDKINAPPEKWSSNELLNLAGAALAVRDRQNSQQLPTHGQQRQQSSTEADAFAEHRPNRDVVTATRHCSRAREQRARRLGQLFGPHRVGACRPCSVRRARREIYRRDPGQRNRLLEVISLGNSANWTWPYGGSSRARKGDYRISISSSVNKKSGGRLDGDRHAAT